MNVCEKVKWIFIGVVEEDEDAERLIYQTPNLDHLRPTSTSMQQMSPILGLLWWPPRVGYANEWTAASVSFP